MDELLCNPKADGSATTMPIANILRLHVSLQLS